MERKGFGVKLSHRLLSDPLERFDIRINPFESKGAF